MERRKLGCVLLAKERSHLVTVWLVSCTWQLVMELNMVKCSEKDDFPGASRARRWFVRTAVVSQQTVPAGPG